MVVRHTNMLLLFFTRFILEVYKKAMPTFALAPNAHSDEAFENKIGNTFELVSTNAGLAIDSQENEANYVDLAQVAFSYEGEERKWIAGEIVSVGGRRELEASANDIIATSLFVLHDQLAVKEKPIELVDRPAKRVGVYNRAGPDDHEISAA